jgi:gamma-glutamyl hercynylcysteine S-oxide synthase
MRFLRHNLAYRWRRLLREHLDMASQLADNVRRLTERRRRPRYALGHARPVAASPPTALRPPDDPAVLIELMVAQGRSVLLLRPQIAVKLNADQRSRALAALERHTAYVPAGDVVLLGIDTALGLDFDDSDPSRARAEALRLEAYYLDRNPVTNRQYQMFVEHGGYEEQSIWDCQIWPVVGDFTDRTGRAGPRHWRDGRCQPGLENHPVVGVNWYEASAYARWCGKRLPSDAEWVKAASWPVALPDGELRQRKFPWGDAMDRQRTNLWGSGPGATLPVDGLPQGASANGIQQLIGNVWEWTSGDLGLETWERLTPDGSLRSTRMRSLRGGAFDTYFDVHATCQFQSGDHPLARKHNIGFRCLVGACDLAPAAARFPRECTALPPTSDEPAPACEEVTV